MILADIERLDKVVLFLGRSNSSIYLFSLLTFRSDTLESYLCSNELGDLNCSHPCAPSSGMYQNGLATH